MSEFGTLHMEFAYLSDITGDPTFTQLVERVRTVIQERPRPKKLYPNYLNPKTGKWGQQHTSMGALGDSFYEYLLKEWLRSGKYLFTFFVCLHFTDLHQSMAFSSIDEDNVYMQSYHLGRHKKPPARNILTISTLQLHRYVRRMG